MTTNHLIDQAQVDKAKRREWTRSLPSEVQLNTQAIDEMRKHTKQDPNGGGHCIAGDLQQFIANKGWTIGYATHNLTVRKWNTFREWVEDYVDCGGLQTTVANLMPYLVQVDVQVHDVQLKAIKSMLEELDPVDRLTLRPQALKVAEVIGSNEIVDLIHDGTKQTEGGYRRNDPLVSNASSTRLNPNTKSGARQQLRAYASDPKRCERYGKDHALCLQAWEAVERGEMSVNEGRIFCGLQKQEPPRHFYVTKDLGRMAQRMTEAMPRDDLKKLVALLQKQLND